MVLYVLCILNYKIVVNFDINFYYPKINNSNNNNDKNNNNNNNDNNSNNSNNKVKTESLRRTRKVLESKLNSGNLFKAINTWALSLFRYSVAFIDWTKKEISEIDRKNS